MYIHAHACNAVRLFMSCASASSRLRTLTLTLTLLNTPLINSNNNQNTDIVDFPATVMVERVIALILFGEGAIATEIKTGEFGVAGDGGG